MYCTDELRKTRVVVVFAKRSAGKARVKAGPCRASTGAFRLMRAGITCFISKIIIVTGLKTWLKYYTPKIYKLLQIK